jgi:hypothetical protein
MGIIILKSNKIGPKINPNSPKVKKAKTPIIMPYNQTLKWKFKHSLALSLTTSSSETKYMVKGIPIDTTVELKKIEA